MGTRVFGGVPLRLQIAAQLPSTVLAIMHLVKGEPGVDITVSTNIIAENAIKIADALIAAHNATCEETPQ